MLVWHTTHCVQSISHAFGGYRCYPTPDASRNHLLIGWITLGDWHNNHHYFPSSARQCFAWYEVDVVFCTLRVLSWLGVLWDLHTPASHELARRTV